MNQLLVGERVEENVETDQPSTTIKEGGEIRKSNIEDVIYLLCFYTKEKGIRYYIDPINYTHYDEVMKAHPEYKDLPKIAFTKHPWNAKRYVSVAAANNDFHKLELYDEYARNHNFETHHASHYFARQVTQMELEDLKSEALYKRAS